MNQQFRGVSTFFGWILTLIIATLIGGTLRTKVSITDLGFAANPEERYDTVVHRDTTYRARHWLQGLVQGEGADLRAWGSPGPAGAYRMTALSTQTRRTAGDLLLHTVTLGIYCPVTANVHSTWSRIEGRAR